MTSQRFQSILHFTTVFYSSHRMAKNKLKSSVVQETNSLLTHRKQTLRLPPFFSLFRIRRATDVTISPLPFFVRGRVENLRQETRWKNEFLSNRTALLHSSGYFQVLWCESLAPLTWTKVPHELLSRLYRFSYNLSHFCIQLLKSIERIFRSSYQITKPNGTVEDVKRAGADNRI